MKKPKICLDCKFVQLAPEYNPSMRGYYTCVRKVEVDLITGKSTNTGSTCAYERGCGILESWFNNRCGVQGRFWKPKEETK